MSERDFDIHEWVAASRAKQGLPPKITDPAALARVARMLLIPEPTTPPPPRHTSDASCLKVARQTVRRGETWSAMRKRVLSEQDGKCACGSSATEVHHIVHVADGGTNARGNLVGLCYGCHKVAHS